MANKVAKDPVFIHSGAAELFATMASGRASRVNESNTEIYLIGTNENYNFSFEENSVSGFFDNVLFKECVFEGKGLQLRNCTFVNVKFKDCTFDGVWFTDLYLEDVIIVGCFVIDEGNLYTIFPNRFRQSKIGQNGRPDEVMDLAWLAGQVSILDGSQVDSDERLARQLAEEDEKPAYKLAMDRKQEEAGIDDEAHSSKKISDADRAWLAGGKPTSAEAMLTRTERRMGKGSRVFKARASAKTPSGVTTKPSTSATLPDLTAPSKLDSLLVLDHRYPAMLPSMTDAASVPRPLAIEEADVSERAAAKATLTIAAPFFDDTKLSELQARLDGQQSRGLRIPPGAPTMFHAVSKAIMKLEDELDGHSDNDGDGGQVVNLVQLD
ncbi:hypothetical protein LTR78_009752 [Recurvomyces mirabilis]|uniref:Uncharacterized protein n=1 Tax=Recurvomyces mirabilis TaxID=574656 RepID=A0AAE0TP43_9PEZI|nr:hypothetical protein LTR78_009752 [Recurvomyces mirabilis]